MTIDVGTGDGRAVLATAAAEPTTLVVGLDAVAVSMAEVSRRAAAPVRRGGLPNALFLLAAAEQPPAELHGLAGRVTVRFPWGSLLRGCLGADTTVAGGIASLLGPGAELELLLAPAARDRLEGLPSEPDAIVADALRAFEPFGLHLAEGRVATADEIRASRSTWARRLLAGQAGPSGLAGGRHAAGTAERTAVLVRLRS